MYMYFEIGPIQIAGRFTILVLLDSSINPWLQTQWGHDLRLSIARYKDGSVGNNYLLHKGDEAEQLLQ